VKTLWKANNRTGVRNSSNFDKPGQAHTEKKGVKGERTWDRAREQGNKPRRCYAGNSLHDGIWVQGEARTATVQHPAVGGERGKDGEVPVHQKLRGKGQAGIRNGRTPLRSRGIWGLKASRTRLPGPRHLGGRGTI